MKYIIINDKTNEIIVKYDQNEDYEKAHEYAKTLDNKEGEEVEITHKETLGDTTKVWVKYT